MGPVPDAYRIAAPIYDAATLLWSGGAIWRSRACQVGYMQPGERALYVGCGRGRAAVRAAQKGVEVLGIDRSPAMLARARSQAQRMDAQVRWVAGDAAEWQPETPFDHVCANHFFNVFEESRMRWFRERLWSWVAPGGWLHVADFRPLHGSRWQRWAQRAHHWIPLSGCRAFTGNARHGIYDHDAWLPPGARVSTQDHRVYGWGPAWYRSWHLQKHA